MTSKEELLQELSEAIISCKKDAVLAAVEKAKQVMEPAEIIENGLAAGMNQVGVLFERGKLFLPHVMMAADAMTAGVKVLEADMPAGTETKKLGVIVNGTVEGDVHDIGKSIVSTMLQSAGFEVHDIGRDVPIKNFVEKAKEVNANMIGISALMTTTLQGQREVIELLKEEGMREKVKVMVGGAPATQAWADKIGADCYAENASEAVAKAKELLVGK
ncbi:dimethylamine corrinoid protein MtbC [Methanosarcina mazei]|jgi:dimethylamine corrinoid protein|uniref:Dimethylamine corrinoid protein 1 n=8 Tax=Methanosarcina mazei TaxID=2209 RepID=MTBC1_METMA|nr:dimethylamine corrinoid protein MtbC [Methanosarcina mazei]P58979.1 RecName: Full=Dimethylamine corrinoid protein 1 [Methanosarcina mazei Go1]AKB41579.1 Dimethylamine methyltransferase corrinoid protein [Methanosarcina mazei WWM610]AKB62492.1 Dimethylamine methyltransferase corrinoid protein [Methanosarcina mazei SarPi]AKB65830.1 Dimethylamine methyltransferase corrinoid protein [Methanosarcina mazei S-6]AKB69031.1 Dimethylamine methyltransferase corrinoid protein [Methanosarcina mazei LYC]